MTRPVRSGLSTLMYATRSGSVHRIVFKLLYWGTLRLSGFVCNSVSVSFSIRTLLCSSSDLSTSYDFLGIYIYSAFVCNSLSLRFPRIRVITGKNNYIAKTTVTMRSYTMVKVLVLSLGAMEVVARSLPQQRSEINARAAGEDGFSNNATKRDGADGEHLDISKPSYSYPSFPKPTRPFQKAMGKSGTTDVLLALSSAVPELRANATETTAKLSMESSLPPVPK